MQLEFSEERFKVLQGNIESYKKELNALREKNQKHSSQGLLHEQTINTLRQVRNPLTHIVLVITLDL